MTDIAHIEQFVFNDDGTFPNSELPVLIYRQPLEKPEANLAALLESRLAANGWTNSWRNGVFDYAHYHSTSHEILAVYGGTAELQFGGSKVGRVVTVRSGDVIVIPAGVAHEQISGSDDFAVVGAYPDGRDWDILRGEPGERPAADERIAQLPIPDRDPLYGKNGPLPNLWQKRVGR